jgi:oligopeptide/dipeptide ABC transporter ATP-binding protein
MALLEVENLSVCYQTALGSVHAVREVSFQLAAGESLALVGETGSGKSTVALALMGLLDGNARIQSGTIRFMDAALAPEDSRAWSRIRGGTMAMIFQNPRGALNPVLTIGVQMSEVIRAHQRLSGNAAREKAAALLGEVGIPDPRFYMGRYPLELSGGMCQRVAIAMALCNEPKLVIADEPTSALDPSIQAQVLDLLRSMKERHRLAMLLISHDLALVSETVEWVAVMYHGRLVEFGSATEVFQRPAHPYTASLIQCQPDLHRRWDRDPLAAIPGAPPAGGQQFSGCAFAPRCGMADTDCSGAVPTAKNRGDSHWAACIR